MYFGHRKLLCELSKFNAKRTLMHLFLSTKFRPERTGFNIYAEYTQLQLTFLCIITLVLRICLYMQYTIYILHKGYSGQHSYKVRKNSVVGSRVI